MRAFAAASNACGLAAAVLAAVAVVAVVAVVAGALAACGPAPARNICNVDADCAGGGRCEAGACKDDATPPGQVADLRVDPLATTTSSITLLFTAPGDDDFGARAAASSYAVLVARGGAEPERVPVAKPPQVEGTPESIVVDGLERGLVYSLALEVTDDAGLVSTSFPIEAESGGALCEPDEDGVLTANGGALVVSRPEHLVRIAGCEVIHADLRIEDTDCVITSLAPLRALRDIDALHISGNPLCGVGLDTLDDLAALESAGVFEVDGSGTLLHAALPSLTQASVGFSANPELEDIALPALAAGSFDVAANAHLADIALPALAAVDHIGVSLVEPFDVALPSLTSLTAPPPSPSPSPPPPPSPATVSFHGVAAVSLPALAALDGALTVDGEGALSTPALTSFTGHLTLLDHATWTTPVLDDVAGTLEYGVDDAIEVPALEVSGTVDVTGRSPSFAMSAQLDGSLVIDDAALTSLGLGVVHGAGARVSVSNTALREIDLVLDGASVTAAGNGASDAEPGGQGGGGISANRSLASLSVAGTGGLSLANNVGVAFDLSAFAATSFDAFTNAGAGELLIPLAPVTTRTSVSGNTGYTQIRVQSPAGGSVDADVIDLSDDVVPVVVEPSLILHCPISSFGGSTLFSAQSAASVALLGDAATLECAGQRVSSAVVLEAPSVQITWSQITVHAATVDFFGAPVRVFTAAPSVDSLRTAHVTTDECQSMTLVAFENQSSAPGPPPLTRDYPGCDSTFITILGLGAF